MYSCLYGEKKIECVLQINIGNKIEIKVKRSFVVGMIVVKSGFLDAMVTLPICVAKYVIF